MDPWIKDQTGKAGASANIRLSLPDGRVRERGTSLSSIALLRSLHLRCTWLNPDSRKGNRAAAGLPSDPQGPRIALPP
jgi:hypothetical protein